jgi:hypothetical protein
MEMIKRCVVAAFCIGLLNAEIVFAAEGPVAPRSDLAPVRLAPVRLAPVRLAQVRLEIKRTKARLKELRAEKVSLLAQNPEVRLVLAKKEKSIPHMTISRVEKNGVPRAIGQYSDVEEAFSIVFPQNDIIITIMCRNGESNRFYIPQADLQGLSKIILSSSPAKISLRYHLDRTRNQAIEAESPVSLQFADKKTTVQLVTIYVKDIQAVGTRKETTVERMVAQHKSLKDNVRIDLPQNRDMVIVFSDEQDVEFRFDISKEDRKGLIGMVLDQYWTKLSLLYKDAKRNKDIRINFESMKFGDKAQL